MKRHLLGGRDLTAGLDPNCRLSIELVFEVSVEDCVGGAAQVCVEVLAGDVSAERGAEIDAAGRTCQLGGGALKPVGATQHRPREERRGGAAAASLVHRRQLDLD